MQITFKQEVTKEVAFVKVSVNVRYEEEDIPNDAPKRNGNTWEAIINLSNKKVVDWEQGKTLDMEYMKVCDQGQYTLLDKDMNIILSKDGYVPNSLLPGDYGDYLSLKINEDGLITNWLENADFDDFTEEV